MKPWTQLASTRLGRRLDAQRMAARLAAHGVLTLAGIYARRRRPLIVNHLVTVRCNLSCPFCYVSGPDQRQFNRDHYPERAEMDTAEMVDFYRQLVAKNFKLAVIVGGEPLLRTDLDDMLAVLERRVYASVFTNGMLLADRLDLLRRAPNVFVSLDAPDDQHDTLRAMPGCFARAISGIEAIRGRYPRIQVAVNMTVTGQNVHRVRDMLRFGREMRLPISFQPPTYDGQFSLADRPQTDATTRVPEAPLVAEAFRVVREAAERQPVVGSRAFLDQIIRDRPTYPCHYPAYVLGPVMPNGDVVACTSKNVMANLRDSSVAEILKSEAFRANAAAGPGCRVGCRDWGIFDVSAVHNHDMGARDLHRYVRTFAAPALAQPPTRLRRRSNKTVSKSSKPMPAPVRPLSTP